MKKLPCRVSLSSLIVPCSDGTIDRLPWAEVASGAMEMTLVPTEAARAANPMLPRRITLTSHTAQRLAQRLRIRACRQRLHDEKVVHHWECRNSWNNLGPVLLSALGCVVVFVMTLPDMRRIFMPPEVFANLSLWCKLMIPAIMAFLSAVLLGVPAALLIVFRHGLKDLFTGRQIVACRTDCQGIEATDQRGEQRYHAWGDLKRIWALGRLDFGGDSPGTITFMPRDVRTWQLYARAIKSTFLSECAVTPEERRRMLRRYICYSFAGTLAAFMLALAEPAEEPRRAMLSLSALMAIFVVLLGMERKRGSITRLRRKSRGSRPRTFGFAKFN